MKFMARRGTSFGVLISSIFLPGMLPEVCRAASVADLPGGIVDAALATRSGPRASTLFTPLNPQQTGLIVENNYSDPKMWGEHYQELIYGGIGTGVAIGDYDNDNKTDIAVFRPSTGQWIYRPSTGGATVFAPWGTAGDIPVPGDYDGDGRDDFAIYRNGTWWVNQSTSGVLVQAFGLSTDTAIPRRDLP